MRSRQFLSGGAPPYLAGVASLRTKLPAARRASCDIGLKFQEPGIARDGSGLQDLARLQAQLAGGSAPCGAIEEQFIPYSIAEGLCRHAGLLPKTCYRLPCHYRDKHASSV